jgi:hypothetical protein
MARQRDNGFVRPRVSEADRAAIANAFAYPGFRL